MFISQRHTGRQGFRAVPRNRVLVSVVSGAIAPPWRYVEDSPGPHRPWRAATNGGRLFLPLGTSILRLDQMGAIPCPQHSVSHGGPRAPVAQGMLREPHRARESAIAPGVKSDSRKERGLGPGHTAGAGITGWAG
jgi:hypothetical protein